MNLGPPEDRALHALRSTELGDAALLRRRLNIVGRHPPTRCIRRQSQSDSSSWPCVARGGVTMLSLRLRSHAPGHTRPARQAQSAGSRFRHKPDAREPGLLGQTHDFDHTAIGDGLVGTQLHLGVGAALGSLLQTGTQVGGRHRLVIENSAPWALTTRITDWGACPDWVPSP